MKYIKTYEDKTEQHKVGDYVCINFHNDEFNTKIIEMINIDIWNHVVLTSDGTKYNVSEDEIVRYLTSEEIEQYNLEKAKFKYNL